MSAAWISSVLYFSSGKRHHVFPPRSSASPRFCKAPLCFLFIFSLCLPPVLHLRRRHYIHTSGSGECRVGAFLSRNLSRCRLEKVGKEAEWNALDFFFNKKIYTYLHSGSINLALFILQIFFFSRNGNGNDHSDHTGHIMTGLVLGLKRRKVLWLSVIQ